MCQILSRYYGNIVATATVNCFPELSVITEHIVKFCQCKLNVRHFQIINFL